jgi:alkylated DNA repair protein (DNA oxidative demethylase)
VARGGTIDERPEGLVYRPDFVTDDEERELVARMDEIDFREVVMHGQAAKRTVRHYGLDYGYESWKLTPGEPLPSEFVWVRDRCAELAGVEPEALAQILVSRYPPGAGIGWHRDAPMFGAAIVGVSLGAPCRMRFQRTAAGVRRVFALELEPRSAYVLAGQARSAWQHSIPPTKALRYSLTFRTLRNPERWSR